MPKYRIMWDEIHSCFADVEASSEQEADDLFWQGEIDTTGSVAEIVDGSIEIREVNNA